MFTKRGPDITDGLENDDPARPRSPRELGHFEPSVGVMSVPAANICWRKSRNVAQSMKSF